MPTPIEAIDRSYLEEHNLPVGTTLENRATRFLHRAGVLDRTQYRIGPYRVDYAWPEIGVVLEVDGFYHLVPGAGDKDYARDRYLRQEGWLVFRADDQIDSTNFSEQLARICRVVHQIADCEQARRGATQNEGGWRANEPARGWSWRTRASLHRMATNLRQEADRLMSG
jgi:very-short-patch-repair endonuclease